MKPEVPTPMPVIALPVPSAEHHPFNPESEPRNKRDIDMRHGRGTKVPWPVAARPIFDALKRAVHALGASLSTAVMLSPLRTVRLDQLTATQTTVDPAVVQQFVEHPDIARVSPKRERHKDGRLLDLPLVIQSNGKRFIYDGHHRCAAALARGEAEVVVRLLKVEDIVEMVKKTTRALSVKLSVLDSEGKPPKEFCIFPMGEVETCKGTFLFDKKAAKAVLSFYAEQGNDLSIDYEHMAVNDPPVVAPAAGFFKLALKDDGLWAVDIKWTARAGEMLMAREYKYFSPAFVSEEKSGRILKLLNVALTNIPATKNMEPLVAARMLGSTINLVKRGVIAVSAGAIEKATEQVSASLKEERHKLRMTAKRRFTRGLVMGLAKSGFTIQSLVFPKAHWSKTSAKRWCKDHDFSAQVTETEKSYRFRQRDPDVFETTTTIALTPTDVRAGDKRCRIKAVGGQLKRKAKASAEVIAEPISTNTKEQTTMARKHEATKTTKTSAKPQPKTERKPVLASAAIGSQSTAEQVALATGLAPTADSGDSDSGEAAKALAEGDSDSDSGDSDSDSGEAAKALADGDSDSDSGDSDSTSKDSDSDMESAADSDADSDSGEKLEEGEKKEEPAASVAASGKSLKSVITALTGTTDKKAQIGKLTALAEAAGRITKLTRQVEKLTAKNRKERIVGRVEGAIKAMRLLPSKRDKAIALGMKHGSAVLKEYFSALPKQAMVRNESKTPKEADVSVKVVAATLTRADREVMTKLGLTEEQFVQTRMATETRKRDANRN